MADCEGDRDRAIELLDAELEAERQGMAPNLMGVLLATIALIVAMTVFATEVALAASPKWVLDLTVGVLIVVTVLAYIRLELMMKRMAANRERRREVHFAIIEAAYRDCVGTSEEE